jgi:hypothetical protein
VVIHDAKAHGALVATVAAEIRPLGSVSDAGGRTTPTGASSEARAKKLIVPDLREPAGKRQRD